MRKVQKTIRRTVLKKPPAAVPPPDGAVAQRLASTMQIPLVEIFTDLPTSTIAHLDIVCPGTLPRQITLNHDPKLVGRDEAADIAIPLGNVSWHHARLICRNEEYVIEDLGSTNGTFVNGLRVSRCVLRNNDQIRIGEARLQFMRSRAEAGA